MSHIKEEALGRQSHRPGKKRREEWLAEEETCHTSRRKHLGDSHTDLARRDVKSGLQRRRLVTHQGGSTWETLSHIPGIEEIFKSGLQRRRLVYNIKEEALG